VLAVLVFFAQQDMTERDFVAQLVLLGESSERSGRTALAAAARAVLRDWETHARRSAALQPGEPKRALDRP
jgi:hypothetical protein